MVRLRYEIEGGNFNRAGNASSNVKKVLKQLNIDQRLIKKVVVALYEAEVNIVAHAYGGYVSVEISPTQIDMIVSDKGPGIPDVEKAMKEGFSTASQKVREMGFGAGMGLPNIKKNVDSLEIDTIVGVGTTLKMTKLFNDAAE
ncbi:MAG TPA: anti-sigma regulatory factor [Prolixibacteraceae bacterium]|nr:anti-sigma regulatory factor [Prolixibacteraceae bacterium]HPS14002.1 anti-sigma regulatory factor [Prolixibacteraceae bacterium]